MTPDAGNFYGTPKPALDSGLVIPAGTLGSAPSGLEQLLLPGAHPSSEGKRRRNRSNVEAMAAKNDDPDGIESGTHLPPPSGMGPDHNHPLHANHSGGVGSGSAGPPLHLSRSNDMSIPSYREDGGGAMGGLSEAELGPLPANWEKAYTERGEVYFIE